MGRSRDLADGTLSELNVDSNTLAVDATNNRVGIGTTSPSQELHIYGTGGVYTQVENSSGTGVYGVDTSGDVTISAEDASNNIRFVTSSGATERMRIDSSGRVTMPYQPRAAISYDGVTYSGDQNSTIIKNGYVEYNVGNHYNNSTGVFTCPVNGFYRIWGAGNVKRIDAASTIDVSARKNSSWYQRTLEQPHTNNGWVATALNVVVECSANDTLDIYSHQNQRFDWSRWWTWGFELIS